MRPAFFYYARKKFSPGKIFSKLLWDSADKNKEEDIHTFI